VSQIPLGAAPRSACAPAPRSASDREENSASTIVVSEVSANEPWRLPWTRWARGEGWTFFWICLIHGLAATGLVLYPTPGWGTVAAAYGLFWLGGLGTTVAYHRVLAHRAARLHPIVEFPLIFFAFLNGSGTPATWTANHRLHHAKADTTGDISSPRLGGFWWSHLRWLWQSPQTSVDKWAPDLDKSRYRVFTRYQIPMLGLSLGFGALFGAPQFFWLGAIRLVFALHAQCVTNSLAHMKRGAKAGEDSSVNLPWLAPAQAFQGENWHGNHHAQPGSARLGWTWKQIDLGWWFLVACEKLGLATQVRRPKFAPAPAAKVAALAPVLERAVVEDRPAVVVSGADVR
jgi:fatty-acid desaturase